MTTDTYAEAYAAALLARIEEIESDGRCHVCDWPEASYVPGYQFPLCGVCHGEWLLAEAATEREQERRDAEETAITAAVLDAWHRENERTGAPPFP